MENKRLADKPGPKLSAAARAAVISQIIGGATLAQINQKLHEDGQGVSLTHQAIWYYRTRPEVKAALQEMDAETIQVGLGLRARRVANLSRIVSDAFHHIEKGSPALMQAEVEEAGGRKQVVDKEVMVPLSLLDMTRCWQTIISAQAQIAVLVGDALMPPMSAAFAAEEAARKEAANDMTKPYGGMTRGQALTLLADVMEDWLLNNGPGDAPLLLTEKTATS